MPGYAEQTAVPSFRHGRRTGRPGAASRQDPRPQAGHDGNRSPKTRLVPQEGTHAWATALRTPAQTAPPCSRTQPTPTAQLPIPATGTSAPTTVLSRTLLRDNLSARGYSMLTSPLPAAGDQQRIPRASRCTMPTCATTSGYGAVQTAGHAHETVHLVDWGAEPERLCPRGGHCGGYERRPDIGSA